MDLIRKLLPLFLVLVFVISSCSEVKETSKSPEKKADTPSERAIPQKVTTVKSWTENNIHSTKYTLSTGACGITSMTAPAYVNQDHILFIDDQPTADTIVYFDRHKNTCHSLYKTKGIGNLTGTDGQLFWTEYDTAQSTNVDWKINSLDLATNKVANVAKGGSYADTPTPTLRPGAHSISWIEYEAVAKQKTITSKLMKYDVKTKRASLLKKEELVENGKSDGDYFILQDHRDENHYLLYQSVFNKGKKDFSFSLMENGKQNEIANEDGIIDFSYSDKQVAFTKERYVKIFNKEKPKQPMVFNAKEPVTTDAPLFINDDTLVFRYGMSDIYILNTKKGVAHSIAGPTDSLSKPVYSNGLLSYGVYNSDGEDVNLEFYVVEIE